MSTEEAEYKLDSSSENNREKASEAVFRSSGLEQVDSLSILSCNAEMVGLSHDVASYDFRCFNCFDFLATVSVRGGVSNKNGGRSISDRSGIGTGLRATAGATGLGDRGGLWTVTVEFIEVWKNLFFQNCWMFVE